MLNGEEIAIIGISCRFPGAENTAEFWDNLAAGRESISFLTEEMQNGTASLTSRAGYVPSIGGVLQHSDQFDAAFFGYSPKEAELMDPQIRIFHEVVWNALEDAGHLPGLSGGNIGLFAAASDNLPWRNNVLFSGEENMRGHFALSQLIDKDFIASRVAYNLNLTGPCYALNTACSTSLVAVHLACQSILNGECDLAVAGGISIHYGIEQGYVYKEGGILSPDGHCRAFDAQAAGTVPASGAGGVVLKLLEDALRDGDNIYAVIKGSAVNNDGNRKVGYTSPGIEGQTKVIRAALRMAGTEASRIRYIEAHGTGTPLGDPVEMEALRLVFGRDTKKSCGIGSLKSNLGHMDVAAGIGGLIKTVLSLKNRQLPPTLNYVSPNPKLDIEHSPFYVVDKLIDMAEEPYPLQAGVSSFGIGGTNCHVVLEEFVAPKANPATAVNHLVLLSARTKWSLDEACDRLYHHVANTPGIEAGDVAYTLAAGRKIFQKRYALVAGSSGELLQALQERTALPGEPATETDEASSMVRPVVFMFSGQGSQYRGMAAGIYRNEPLFRQQLDSCFQLYKDITGQDPATLIFSGEGDDVLNHTAYTQPLLFLLEYALAKYVMSLGVNPDYMIGHSIGEYVAACLAGVFSFEEGLQIVIKRGELMQSAPAGAMLSVAAPIEQVTPVMEPSMDVAAVNAPGTCVIAGPAEDIARLSAVLKEQRISSTLLKTSHAFHSAMMDPVLETFGIFLKGFAFRHPVRAFISNIDGQPAEAHRVADAAYWVSHLRHTVEFSAGASHLLKAYPRGVFVELGPGHALASAVRKNTAFQSTHKVLNVIKSPIDKKNDHSFFLSSLASLWMAGVDMDVRQRYAGQERRMIHLPGYAFEPRHFNSALAWRSISEIKQAGNSVAPPAPSESLFHVPLWEQQVAPAAPEEYEKRNWLVFVPEGLSMETVSLSLKEYSRNIVWVKEGSDVREVEPYVFSIHPERKEDYILLLQRLMERGVFPERVIHAWTLIPGPASIISPARVEKYKRLGFYSVINLVQSIGALGIKDQMTIGVLTNGSMNVLGNEEWYPEKSLLQGLVKIIPLEYSGLRCKYIDVSITDLEVNGPFVWKKIIEQMLLDGSHPQIAIRGRHTWLRNYRSISLQQPGQGDNLIKQNGVYLVTGGLGGMALFLARHLVTVHAATVILVSRSSPQHLDGSAPQDRIKLGLIEEMRQGPGKVIFWQADITDENAMETLLRQYETQFPHIHGVLHTAATIDSYGAIQRRKRSDFEDSLKAKVAGTLALCRLFKDRPLDLMVLFSSGGSIQFGRKYGESGYVAANDFLDAMAGYSFNGRTLIRTINWCDWSEVGISVRSIDQFYKNDEPARAAAYLEFRKHALTPDEGVKAFLQIMASDEPRVALSHETLRDLDGAAENGWETKKALYQQHKKEKPLNRTSPQEKPGIAPTDELQKSILSVWQNYFGYENIGVRDNIFELGGNSLDIAQINEILKEQLHIEIPLVTFFEYPTIDKLTEYIRSNGGALRQEEAGARIEEGKTKLSKIRALARK